MTGLEKEMFQALYESPAGSASMVEAVSKVAKKYIERAYMVSAINEASGYHNGDDGLIKGKNEWLKENGIV